MIKHTLYVGLNDKDTHQQKITTLAARDIVNNLILSSGYDGATISDAIGIYKHSDNSFVVEQSLRIEILFGDDVKTNELCEHIKSALNQESVAVQKDVVNSTLI